MGPLKVTTAEFMGALKFAARTYGSSSFGSYVELRGATRCYVVLRGGALSNLHRTVCILTAPSKY